MRSILTGVALAFIFVGSIVGCTSKEQPSTIPPAVKEVEKTAIEAAKPAVPGGVPLSVSIPAKAEIACAKCIYKKVGVTACVPAVKVGDKILMLSGGGITAHDHELCTAPKQATIEGKIEGDKFVATKVEIGK